MTSLEIEAFLMVQRTGSVTKAAELLYISQSSLSTRLRTLERELGVSLFARGNGVRTVQLTPEGERFLPLARQHRELEEKMRSLGRGMSDGGVLRVSAFNSVGSYLLPPVYRRFTQSWPNIRLEIEDMATVGAMRAFAQGRLDVAFSTLNENNEYVVAIPFLSEPMAFLCAAGADYPDLVSLTDLSMEHEVYSFWSAEIRQWHQSALGSDVEPKVRVELTSQIQPFIAQPGAWAIVPQSIADALKDDPALRHCRMDFSVPDRCIYILCNRKTRNSEPVLHFLDCLRSVQQERGMPGLLL